MSSDEAQDSPDHAEAKSWHHILTDLNSANDAMLRAEAEIQTVLSEYQDSDAPAGDIGPTGAATLAELSRVLRDHAAQMRRTVELFRTSAHHSDAYRWWTEPNLPAVGQATKMLPLNRKERFYTGTVLPMIVGGDGFHHLSRFLELCGLQDVAVEPDVYGVQNIQFFTEYSFSESVHTTQDRARWPETVEGDTPDLVIVGEDWLLAVEAKMFHRPTIQKLNQQIAGQKALVDLWAEKMSIHPRSIRHVALLPSALVEELDDIAVDVVTWEAVVEEFKEIAPSYWLAMLRAALNRYADSETYGEGLRSRSVLNFGSNARAKMLGQVVWNLYQSGELPFRFIGRHGGLMGKRFAADLSTGEWRNTEYEVSDAENAANKNWFPIADFVAAVGPNGA